MGNIVRSQNAIALGGPFNRSGLNEPLPTGIFVCLLALVFGPQSSNAALSDPGPHHTQAVVQPDMSPMNGLGGGFVLRGGQCRYFESNVRLCMQTDGNLVLYEESKALWATSFLRDFDLAPYAGTSSDWSDCGICYASFQTDGNMVLYNPKWNGNAQHAYWAIGISSGSAPLLQVSRKWPYVSVRDSSGSTLWPNSARSYAKSAYFVSLPTTTGQSVAWDQVPAPSVGAINLFVGRQCVKKCDSELPTFALIVAAMDWSAHTLTVVNESLLAGPQIINGNYKIATVYDPTLLWIKNQLWVAFECSDWLRLGAASCMGPIVQHARLDNKLDPSGRSWYVDSARTTVVVKNNCDGSHCHSASAPKLFTWHGVTYLYYTAVHSMEERGAGGPWTGASTRGIRLQATSDRSSVLFFAAGSRTSINSVDSRSIEVMRVDVNDPSSNQFADGTGVYALGAVGAETVLIMTGELGGNTNLSCMRTPQGLDPKSEGCYRQFIAKATAPLGAAIFNDVRVPESESYMPSNFSQYVRRFVDPDGRSMLWGAYESSTTNGANQWMGPSNTMWAYPLDFAMLTYRPHH